MLKDVPRSKLVCLLKLNGGKSGGVKDVSERCIRVVMHLLYLL